jgi:hypothetical protein
VTSAEIDTLHQTAVTDGIASKALAAKDEIIPAEQKSFCSLFVIFGFNASIFVNEDGKENYELLGSYPDLQLHPEVAAEHKFTQDMKWICFPEA